ncbi:MAG: hypothetical protein FJY42_08695 [Betaproteobacteria bacterium]|nr:hypothetical protein [Betaproteobacteria bacterium]
MQRERPTMTAAARADEGLIENLAFGLYRPETPGRALVEAFIGQVYRDRYGACVSSFAPVLLGLRDHTGRLIAAAGYRIADTGPLFLERYLEQPIEALIHSQGAVSRSRIVEVGHLASQRPGAGARLARLTACHLLDLGLQWVSSTLTEELQRFFTRRGIRAMALGAADPERLGPQAGLWGRYYEHRPVVVVGRLDVAVRQLSRGQRV